MSNDEFRRPVSVDTAPRGSRCEWCGKPAEVQLTAIGGNSHNEGGLFCRSCGEEFSRAVANSASIATTNDASVQSF
jgi:protein-arginine kinase activator protein McsA